MKHLDDESRQACGDAAQMLTLEMIESLHAHYFGPSSGSVNGAPILQGIVAGMLTYMAASSDADITAAFNRMLEETLPQIRGGLALPEAGMTLQ